MNIFKVIGLMILLIGNLVAQDFNTMFEDGVQTKTRELKQKFNPELKLNFEQPNRPNYFYPSFDENNYKNYNLFDYGCEGIRYTGAVEQALIDDVLEIKKEIKAMFDPITKISKLDAALFSIGLITCTYDEFSQFFTGEGTGTAANGNTKTVGEKSIPANSGSTIISNAKNKLNVLFNSWLNMRSVGSGTSTESNLDLSGTLKGVWDEMDKAGTFNDIMTCVMDTREEIVKWLYEHMMWNIKLELELKTMLAGQCQFNLESQGDEESLDELLGSPFKTLTKKVVNSLPFGSVEVAKPSELDSEFKSKMLNEINGTIGQDKYYETDNFTIEENIDPKNPLEKTDSCGPVKSGSNGFYRDCGTIIDDDGTMGKTIQKPVTITRTLGDAVATQIWGSKKVDNTKLVSGNISRPGRNKGAIFGVDANGQPTLTHSEIALKKKLLGNPAKIQKHNYSYHEGTLTSTEIIAELNAAGLLYNPVIDGVEQTEAQPSYLSNFLKNINLFAPKDKEIITNYFFTNKKVFEDSIDIRMSIPKHQNNSSKKSTSTWAISRELNQIQDYYLSFDVDRSDSNKGFSTNLLRKTKIISNNNVYSPRNSFSELISNIYITKCNEGNEELPKEKLEELQKIMDYYNVKYTKNIGLKALYYLYKLGLPERINKQYRIIKDESNPGLLWVNDTHLEYLVFRKQEKYSIIAMLAGFQCTLEEHKELIKQQLENVKRAAPQLPEKNEETIDDKDIMSYIKTNEGFIDHAFWDVKQWSIGYGHQIIGSSKERGKFTYDGQPFNFNTDLTGNNELGKVFDPRYTNGTKYNGILTSKMPLSYNNSSKTFENYVTLRGSDRLNGTPAAKSPFLLKITEEKASEFFEEEYYNKYKPTAENLIGYDIATPEIRKVLIDLTYNMGVNWQSKFRNATGYFETGEYEKAAHELLWNDEAKTQKTGYYSQTGNRAYNNAQILLGYGDVVLPPVSGPTDNIWKSYDGFAYKSPNKDENLDLRLSFSSVTNIFPSNSHSIRFNNKLDYYEAINSANTIGGKPLKYKFRLIMKELERKMLDYYGLEEKIRDLNKRLDDVKATGPAIITLKNNNGSGTMEYIENQKMKYIKNMAKYFR